MTPGGRGSLLGLLSGLLLGLMLLPLAGCGFHLRGNYVLPPQLAPIHVAADSLPELRPQVLRILAGHRLPVTEDRAAAGAILRLLDAGFDSRVSAVDRGGQVLSYELRYQLSFDALTPDGRVLLPRDRVEVVTQQLNPDIEVLGKAEEAALIRDELAAEAVESLLRRIFALL